MFRRSLRSQTFGGSVLKLATGTGVAQLVLLASSPLLTRLFSPAQFGRYAVFVAAVSVLLEVVTLRFHFAIPLERAPKDAFATFVSSLASVCVVVITVAVLGILFRGPITQFVVSADPTVFLILLCIVLAVQGVNQTLQYWALREDNFGVISRTRALQGLVTASSQVGLGAFGVTGSGLLLGHTAGQFAGNYSLFRGSWPSLRDASQNFTWSHVLSQVRKHRRFPMFSVWSGLANTLSIQLPVLVLTSAFGASIAGLYALAQRAMQTPLSVLGSAIGQVYFSRAARSSPEDLGRLSLRVFQFLTRVSMPIIALVAMLSSEIFGVVFGSEWREAGFFAQVLAPWVFLVFVASPLSMLPSVIQRQGGEMLFQITLLGARIGALVLGAASGDFAITIMAFSAVSSAWFLYFVFWNLSLVGIPRRAILGILLAESLRSLTMLSPLILALWISAPTAAVWVCAATSTTAISISILFAIKKERSR